MYFLSVCPEGFKEFTLDDEESYSENNCLVWSGESKAQNWQAPKLQWLSDEFTNSDDKVGDFLGFSGVIAVSKKAKNILEGLLDSQAEFLPVIGPDGIDEWFLLNVTNVVDCLDRSKSKYKIYSSGRVGPCTHGFINEPDESVKIYQVKGYQPRIFISDSVKRVIESEALTGVLIREYINP